MKILAIDDDKISQKFILRAVKDEFEVRSAYSGEEGLQIVEQYNPDIILLDVEMPGLNGYEVCDKLKLSDITNHIPVVFLSGRGSLQERMRGFEVGADDYIVKPFVKETLLAKLNVLLKYRDANTNLREQVNEAQKTAYIAMTGSSELGQAMGLVELSYAIYDYDGLAKHIFNFTNNMQLNCSIIIKVDDKIQCYSSKGNISPLEQELLIMLSGGQRFHDFGCRTFINYPNIALLIKNMPLEDMERYGRIKDLLPPILGAFDAKVRTLNIENVIKQQNIELNESFQIIKDTIRDLGRSLRENAKGGHLMLSKMLHDLSQALPGMALEDDQENYILDQIETAIQATSSITDAGENISGSFEMVIQQLQTLVEKQNTLAESSVLIRKEQESESSQQNNETSMDIELF